jgi:flagellum-specific ATP synthase
MASSLRSSLSAYYENYDLISIGAYKAGSNPRIDAAIQSIDRINAFLRQGINEKLTFDDALRQMQGLVS